MRTYVKYEHDDYDEQETTVTGMTMNELVDVLEYIDRGYIGHYNFTGTEDDFENHRLHMVMNRVIGIIREIGKCK